MSRQLPYAFRVNTLKASRANVLKRFKQYGISVRPVTFYPDAFVTDDLRVGSTLEHFLGHVYIQEVVSFLPPLALDLGQAVLDSCAAPGSKTTQLAALMENRGLLVANDIEYMRLKALTANIERLGVTNTVVVNMNVLNMKGKFDSILVDAPCSSEGTLRKNPDVIGRWSESQIRASSALQKRLIVKCFEMLKEGGSLVYSTCTFAPEENEAVVDYLLSNSVGAKLERFVPRGFVTRPGVSSWNGKPFGFDTKLVARVWPQDNDTGGFFIAKVRKSG
jgi:NOL1/NOP2/sun family putative RNA methylase